MEKIKTNLGSVQKTLLLPLWGRASETQKAKPLLKDETAVRVINMIDYDFSTIAGNTRELTKLAWIGRSILTDRVIKKHIEKYPSATIVNLGCGLDTTFERVDNGIIQWFDLDLPDVINLRKNFLQENNRRKFISCSLLDEAWFNELNSRKNVLFLASGVFYYLEEQQVKDFLIKLAGCFSGCEILFDAASPFGVKISNKVVIQGAGMNESSYLKWGLENIKDIEQWNSKISILKKHSFFKGIRRKIPLKLCLETYVSDYYKVMFMLHLQFINS